MIQIIFCIFFPELDVVNSPDGWFAMVFGTNIWDITKNRWFSKMI